VFLGVATLFAEGAMVFLTGDGFRPKTLNGICTTEGKMPSMGVDDKFRNSTINTRLLQANATDDMT